MREKTILITGCSSGIGYDAAYTLAKRGWRVLATCRKEADAARLREEGLESWALDYADEASVASGAEEALNRADGRIDALFNNGAFALPAPTEDLSRAGIRAVFETNLYGPHQLTCALMPAMRAAGGGRIVQCSSVLGFIALPYRGAYNASKFALESLTDTMRREIRGSCVKLILIEPGPIDTKFRINAQAPYETWVRPAREASVHPDARWRLLEERLYARRGAPDHFELPPSAVTAKLIRALEAPRPRARYFVTTPTYFGDMIRRFLPTSLQDRLLSA